MSALGMLLNTDMRRIKLVGDRHTLQRMTDSSRHLHLCDYCGRNLLCKVGKRIKRTESWVEVATLTCEEFVPVLAFRDLRITRNRFNTVRLGQAWAARVKKGTKVALVDSVGTRLFAEVLGVDCLPFDEALNKHAKFNHMITDAGIDPGDAPSELKKLLEKYYGGGFTANASYLSVLYLRTMDEEQLQA